MAILNLSAKIIEEEAMIGINYIKATILKRFKAKTKFLLVFVLLDV